MLQGTLTHEQVALIVNLCELAGKVQGVSSFKALGSLLGALEQFEPVADEPVVPEVE